MADISTVGTQAHWVFRTGRPPETTCTVCGEVKFVLQDEEFKSALWSIQTARPSPRRCIQMVALGSS